MGAPGTLQTMWPWLWIIAGVALCAAEIGAPGAFMIWLGFAAIATGLLNLITPVSMVWSLIAFSVFAMLFVLIGRRIYGADERSGQRLNDRAASLIGQSFALDQAIENGFGRIRVGDSLWRVNGVDAPAGVRVRVTAVAEDGMTLIVERA